MWELFTYIYIIKREKCRKSTRMARVVLHANSTVLSEPVFNCFDISHALYLSGLDLTFVLSGVNLQ